jgi:hypothetical protein
VVVIITQKKRRQGVNEEKTTYVDNQDLLPLGCVAISSYGNTAIKNFLRYCAKVGKMGTWKVKSQTGKRSTIFFKKEDADNLISQRWSKEELSKILASRTTNGKSLHPHDGKYHRIADMFRSPALKRVRYAITSKQIDGFMKSSFEGMRGNFYVNKDSAFAFISRSFPHLASNIKSGYKKEYKEYLDSLTTVQKIVIPQIQRELPFGVKKVQATVAPTSVPPEVKKEAAKNKKPDQERARGVKWIGQIFGRIDHIEKILNEILNPPPAPVTPESMKFFQKLVRKVDELCKVWVEPAIIKEIEEQE